MDLNILLLTLFKKDFIHISAVTHSNQILALVLYLADISSMTTLKAQKIKKKGKLTYRQALITEKACYDPSAIK